MLVLSALLMMLVSALTIESPVTTVYRIAPNAAAAIVPIAFIWTNRGDSELFHSNRSVLRSRYGHVPPPRNTLLLCNFSFRQQWP